MKNWIHVTWVFAANIICVLILGLPIYLINRLASPHIRGFDPSDASNALPYKPDTVKPLLAAAVSFSTAIVPIICVELFVKFYFYCESCPNASSAKVDFAVRWRSTWIVWVAVGRIFAAFFAGYALTGVITDMIKYMVARPRPSFLHMCLPDYTKTPYAPCHHCGSPSNPVDFWPMCPGCPYIPPNITSVVCTQNDWWTARNMWLSFPSGHSSYSFYAGTFLALYLFKRLAAFRVVIFSVVALRPLLVFAAMAFSLYVGLSRVSDDRHHVSDVMAGAAIGVVVGLFSAYYVAFQAIRNLPNYISINRDCASAKEAECGNAFSKTQNASVPFLEDDAKVKAGSDQRSTEVVIPEQATPF